MKRYSLVLALVAALLGLEIIQATSQLCGAHAGCLCTCICSNCKDPMAPHCHDTRTGCWC